MSGTLGFENTPIRIDHGVESIDGKAAKTDQTVLVNESERDADGVITASDINKQSEFNEAFLTWAKAQAATHGTTLGAFLTELKRIGTYTITSDSAINRPWIKQDTVVSVDYFTTTSPYVSNDLATLGTGSDLSVNPLNNHNPTQDDELGGVALVSGELEIDNAGTGNNTGDSLNWRRLVFAKFHVTAWRNGSTEPVIGYGTRGSSSGKSNIIHFERADAAGNMYINYQKSNGTAARLEAGIRRLSGAHFQLGDVVELAVENHKTSFSAADSATPLQLVVVARIIRNGTLIDEIQFDDTTGMANVDHYDYGRVYVYGGNSAQTDVSAAVEVETWQSITTIPSNEFLRHSQLLTALSHRPTATSKLGGFWVDNPIEKLNFPAIISANNFYNEGKAFNVRTSDYTATNDDLNSVIPVNSNSGVVTITLPNNIKKFHPIGVLKDANDTNYVRVIARNLIANSTALNNIIKSDSLRTGTNGNYDFVDLPYANDHLIFERVNDSSWWSVDIKRYTSFEVPVGGTAGQVLERTATTSTIGGQNYTKYRSRWINKF